MIEIRNVIKQYNTVRAVDLVNLTIPEQCLFGLIGPDGAGKTTLFRLITTLLKPDKGSVTVFGKDTVSDYKDIRRFTGYMPGRFSLYADLTVTENLSFYATIFGTTVQANYPIIEPVFSLLEPFRNRLAGRLSGGMKQKLALCCALIHNPRLLVLDEPTTGVDAVSRKEFWETLDVLKRNGMTIIVSTPYMDEAYRCDTISLMQSGQIMITNKPGDILTAYKTPLFEIKSADRMKTLSILRSIKEVKRAYLFGHSIHLAVDSIDCDAAWLNSRLSMENAGISEIKPVAPDFEDCFIDAVESKNE
jgi:ABC-2 type transport system ATP-binding protein